MGAVSVESVTVGYGDDPPVLRGASLRAQPGTLTAVTGPSGAGKTTLLRTVAGRLRPRQGRVTLGGQALDAPAGAGVVLVPQDNGLATILTASENLLVALVAAGLPGPAARQAAAAALARLGLADQSEQLVEELSGGQQQRTAIARGLALQGRVLLADEVTSALDAANRELVLDLLRAEARRGAAVLLATHDPAAAEACDREVRLVGGRAEPVR